ncbi:hypothetical protein MLD38_022768 [Melastoma candidum]|uniref:Uncharacterized protein n=1 Tax=Melastoma candidum TaxID=119954 RepID=A0ACB9QLJ6_9MYRT|nr:hypothetical protein MLD38_022768 [Melastoma candidum]
MIASTSSLSDAFPRPRAPSLSFDPCQALSLLRNCDDLDQLKRIHARILRCCLSRDRALARKMIHVCCSHGGSSGMRYASAVFERLDDPDTFTWNVMIRGYAKSGNPEKAVSMYNDMLCRGFVPDKFTFPFVANACAALRAVDKGREVHGFAVKAGLFSRDLFLQNTVMDLYFKCGEKECAHTVFETMTVRCMVSLTTMVAGLVASGDLDSARKLFDEMPARNVVSWTAMIDGYVSKGRFQEAFFLFRRMRLEGVRPNEFTLVCLLTACTELESLDLGKWVHNYAKKNGFKIGVFLGTALIDMYSKCGSLPDANQVFLEMKSRSLATWNSMITSLGVHGRAGEALALFGQLLKLNVSPDEITFVGVLNACLHLNQLERASKLFRYMTDCCGIAPLPEHYACLIELHTHADGSMPLHSPRYMVGSCTDGVETSVSTFNGRELQCVKVDVG